MRNILVLLFVCFSLSAHSQTGITFTIEELSKPEGSLHMQAHIKVMESLILSDVDMSISEVEEGKIGFPFAIVAQSAAPDSLVNFGYHSFFNGMYGAYAEHRPFVLSPDMIWLLISQGFARHVNANSEELRHYFVDFSGKQTLIVKNDNIDLNDPRSPWEEVFPEFTKQIAACTGSELVELLTSDFSTTRLTEKIASEITIMEAMKSYFEFVVMRMVCGIPEITLQGTPEDWEKVLDKTKRLAKYDLEWWTSELEPILENFVKASRGKIDKRFWRNMFKYHTQRKYGAPNIIDGWIVKFFPYDKNGKRNNLRVLEGGENLPEEIVKVDLKHIEQHGDGTTVTTPLELWAGFIGLEQDVSSYALTPKIGWMIRKKDIDEVGLKQKFGSDSKSGFGYISIRVKEIPTAIFELTTVRTLEIAFIDRIIIPDRLAEIKIGTLELSGEISNTEIKRIKNMFPKTRLVINQKVIHEIELDLNDLGVL